MTRKVYAFSELGPPIAAKTTRASPPNARTTKLAAEALGHHQAMRLEEAERLYRRILAAEPDQADSLQRLGVLCAQGGRFSEAADYFVQLVSVRPDHAEGWCNLGAALRDLGRLDDALAAFRAAVTLKPDLAEAHNNRGDVLKSLGRLDEAATAYHRAIERGMGQPETFIALAKTLRALGRSDAAVAVYEALLARHPGRADAWRQLADALHDASRLDEAARAYSLAIRHDPARSSLHNNLGIVLHHLGRNTEAMAAYEQAIALTPDLADAHNNLGVALQALGRPQQAVAVHRRALALKPDHAQAYNNLGNALRELGQTDAALEAYAEAIALEPECAETRVNHAAMLLELGRTEAGREAIDQALTLDPASSDAWRLRADLKRFEADDADITAMEGLLAAGGLRPQARSGLGFALGKAWMDVGDIDCAFDHLDEANRLHRASFDYDVEADVRGLAQTAELFTAEAMAGFAGAGELSDRPVFIVGMPRSGTTLVEQILASHPDVHGAGELALVGQLAGGLPPPGHPLGVIGLSPEALSALGRAYIRQTADLGEGSRRLIDKMPNNFRFLGLVQAMLPKARIIHCRRDPIDTGLSCYSKMFTGRQPFAYDLAELGRFLRGYQALADHWRDVLPADRFIEVDYEAVVDDLEGQGRRLVAFLGLDWNEACLRFHETDRQVRTASLNQVRRPLFRSSLGRARPYVRRLGPLIDQLNRDL